MKTIQIKDQASEMTREEILEHVENAMISALVTIEEDASERTLEERLDALHEELAELLKWVRE